MNALLAILGSHHQGSLTNLFVRLPIDMTIGRYNRHHLETSVMFLYPLNLVISRTKVSLFRWSLSYLFYTDPYIPQKYFSSFNQNLSKTVLLAIIYLSIFDGDFYIVILWGTKKLIYHIFH